MAAFGVMMSQSAHAQSYRVLYNFTDDEGIDANPLGGLISDGDGFLYGTTSGNITGSGDVFNLNRNGEETILYIFGDQDGRYPQGNLVPDAAGNLFGTTADGGLDLFYGEVYKITPSGQLTVLHSFSGGYDGSYPLAGVILDTEGNVYGTTSGEDANKYGNVFKLTPLGELEVLYTFSGGGDGSTPAGRRW